MTITQILPIGKKKSRVLTDEGLAFAVYQTELSKLRLEEGAVLSPAFLEEELFPLLTRRAYSRAIHLLTVRDYSEQDLRRKYEESGIPEFCCDRAVSLLKEHRFLDDRRFAESYIRSHSENKSHRQLMAGLMQHGISRDTADELLADILPDEEAQIQRLLEKRRYNPDTADAKEQQRTASFLARKGYGWDVVLRAVQPKNC